MKKHQVIATMAVRIAKYLVASGVAVGGFSVSKSGQSAYVRLAGQRRAPRHVRVSDHPKTGRRSRQRIERRRLLCVALGDAWDDVEGRVKHFIEAGPCCEVVDSGNQKNHGG